MFFASRDIASKVLTRAAMTLKTASFEHMPSLKADTKALHEVAEAVWQSGIMFAQGSYAWLGDERIIAALMIAHEMHDGKRRKNNASQHRIVHEIRTAHETFNAKTVTTWLAHNGYDPLLGAFCAVAHDIFENHQSANIKRLSRPQIMHLLEETWEDHQIFQHVITPAMRYMTDETPLLEKGARLRSQKAKGYNAYGKFVLGIFHQHLRFYDKLDHVISDHINTMRQKCIRQHNPENYIGDEAMIKTLDKSVQKAIDRLYVMSFPDVAKSDKRKYTKALIGLKLTARHMTARKDWADIVRISPVSLAKHWIKGAVHIGKPSSCRAYCPLLVPVRAGSCSRQTNNSLQIIHKTP